MPYNKAKHPHNRISVPRSAYVKTLRDLFKYDKETGHLIKRNTGEILGKPSPSGTMRCTFQGQQVTVAQLVWMYHYGRAPVGKVLSSGRGGDKIMVKGVPAVSTKIEHLYDSKAHTKGYTAVDPEDEGNIHNQQRAASANDVGITWQKSHNQFKVVIRGQYIGMRKTLDEARKLKDNYLAIKANNNTRWFGEAHTDIITPEQLKQAYHTKQYEHAGRQYRHHAGWDKFIYGVGDNEVRGTEEQIKRYIDALNKATDTGDTTDLFAVSQELASASKE